MKTKPAAPRPAQAPQSVPLWEMNDTPQREAEVLLDDKPEVNSIASTASMYSRHLEVPEREIAFFSDLSPVTRRMANLTPAEEQAFGLEHLIKVDPAKVSLEKIQWTDAAFLATGKVAKSDLAKPTESAEFAETVDSK